MIPFSSRARVVLAIARALAAGRGERDVMPVHIALGLLREGENAAISILQYRAVPVGRLRRDLERLLGIPPGGSQPDEVVLPLTPGESRLIDYARSWCNQHGDDHIGPEHLLVALVADKSTEVSQIFAKHGIDTNVVTASLEVVIHKHPLNETPPTSR